MAPCHEPVAIIRVNQDVYKSVQLIETCVTDLDFFGDFVSVIQHKVVQ